MDGETEVNVEKSDEALKSGVHDAIKFAAPLVLKHPAEEVEKPTG